MRKRQTAVNSIFAESEASKSSCSGEQAGRRLSKSCRPATALSRLAKLARTSPGMSPGHPPPQPPQATAAVSDPLHASTNTGRAVGEDTPGSNGAALVGGLPCTAPVRCAQAGAAQVVNENNAPGMAQQQQQQQEVSLHGRVDKHVAACNGDRGGASRLSQAGACFGGAFVYVSCVFHHVLELSEHARF